MKRKYRASQSRGHKLGCGGLLKITRSGVEFVNPRRIRIYALLSPRELARANRKSATTPGFISAVSRALGIEKRNDEISKKASARRAAKAVATTAALGLLSALLALPAFADPVLVGPRLARVMTEDVLHNAETNTVKAEDLTLGTCLNCGAPFAAASAAWWWVSSGETANTGHLGAVLYGEVPLAFGQDSRDPDKPRRAKIWGRGALRVSFQQNPGQSVTLDPTNFQSIEIMPLYKFTFGNYGGVRLSAVTAFWINQKITPKEPEPSATTTWGWGAGLAVHVKDGSRATILLGQNSAVGAVVPDHIKVDPEAPPVAKPSPLAKPSRGVQVRGLAKILIPKIEGTGAFVFDTSFSLLGTSPFVPDPGGPTPPASLVSSSITNVTFLYGVSIEAVPLFQVLFKHGDSSPSPATVRPPEVSKPADARFGPPAPPSHLVAQWVRDAHRGAAIAGVR